MFGIEKKHFHGLPIHNFSIFGHFQVPIYDTFNRARELRACQIDMVSLYEILQGGRGIENFG